MKRLALYIVPPVAVVLAAVAIGNAATPAPPKPGCVTVSLAVVVDFNNIKHKEIIDHERSSVDRGQPRILHIDRADADAHRAASLRGIPVRRGFDRDEYPPAASAEGGDGADVAYVDPTQNRSSGAVMSAQLRPFCDGQAFIIEP